MGDPRYSGLYINVRTNKIECLKKHAIWKYGETTTPKTRYAKSYLLKRKVYQNNEFYGTQMEIKIMEKKKLYGYFFLNGELPLGNKIFR